MAEEEFVAQFTAAIGAEPGTIQIDTPLETVEMWDSMGYLAAIMLLDEKMGVAIDPQQMVGAATPRAILEMARQRV